MPINQILPFAIGAGANVLTPGDYAEADYRQQGFQDGIVESYDYNTVLRLASFVAAGLGEFTAKATGLDVLDDGDVEGFAAKFASALRGSLGAAVPYYRRDTSAVVNRITTTIEGLDSLVEGTALLVRVNQANTGPTTFRLNTRPSVAITRPNGDPLAANAFSANSIVLLVYGAEGTMQLIGEVTPPPAISLWHSGRDTGAANALVVNDAKPAVAELAPFLTVLVQIGATNTGPATLNLAGLGAKPIVRGAGAPLQAGDLTLGTLALFGYDGTSWQILWTSGLFTAGAGISAVQRPVNVSPAAGATNVSPTPVLTGSTYYSLYGIAQGGAQFQVANDPDFTSLALDYTQSGVGLSYTVPSALATNKTLYWRLRYKNANGVYSDWSLGTAFTTGATAIYINAPTNQSPADNEPAASVRPTLTCSTFAVTGGSDTHAASQWQIARDASFTNPVYSSGDVSDLTAHTPPSGSALAVQLDYFWRVRHKGSTLGYGAWSQPTTFRTQAQPDRPTLLAPVDGTTNAGLGPLLKASAFSMPGGGTHAAAQWQVSTSSTFASSVYAPGDDAVNLTTVTLPGGTLAFGTVYYARVRYKEAGGTYSLWSLTNTFTTVQNVNVAGAYGETGWSADNSRQELITGVDNRLGGIVVSMYRLSGLSTWWSNKRGKGRVLIPTFAGGETAWVNNIDAYSANSFTVYAANPDGVGGLNVLSSDPRLNTNIALAFGPRLCQETIVQHVAGTADTLDLSVLGTVGWAVLINLDGNAAGWWTWHRNLPPGQNFHLNQIRGSTTGVNYADPAGGVSGTAALLSAAGGTVNIAASAPTGRYAVIAFAHNEAYCACGSVTPVAADQIGNGVVTVTLPWKPQMVMEFLPTVGGALVHSRNVPPVDILGVPSPALAYQIGGIMAYADGLTWTDTGFTITDPPLNGPNFKPLNPTDQRLFWAIRAAGA